MFQGEKSGQILGSAFPGLLSGIVVPHVPATLVAFGCFQTDVLFYDIFPEFSTHKKILYKIFNHPQQARLSHPDVEQPDVF